MPIGPPISFHTHKQAESPKDYQDAYAVNAEKGRYAIADGATKSFFPAQWARLLADYFCDDNDSLNIELFQQQEWQAWLRPIQKEWNDQIKTIVQNTPANKYYVRNRYARKEPGVSTFVGVQIDMTGGQQINWQAMIIGDSCLFHVHGNEMRGYLINESQGFDYHPESFASIKSYNNKSQPTFIGGTVQEGDFLLLATDALAKWILTHYENGSWRQVWHTLRRMSQENFEQIIDQARQDGQTPLENDDVTLMIIPIGERARRQLNYSPTTSQKARPQRKVKETRPSAQQSSLQEFFRSNQQPTATKPVEKNQPETHHVAHPVASAAQDSTISQSHRERDHSHPVPTAQDERHRRTKKLEKRSTPWRQVALVASALFVLSACLNVVLIFEWFSAPESESSQALAPVSTPEQSQNLVAETAVLTISAPTAPPPPTLTPSSTVVPPSATSNPTQTATSAMPADTPIPTVPASDTIPPIASVSVDPYPPALNSSETAPPPQNPNPILAKGTQIYSQIESNQILITITNEITATLTPESNEWNQIQFDAWVISVYNGNQLTVENEGRIEVRGDDGVNARQSPSLTSDLIIGRLPKDSLLHKVAQTEDEVGHTWYQIRITGFVRKATP